MSSAAPASEAAKDRAFAAAQDFLLGTKTFWTTRMFPALRSEYEARIAARIAPIATVAPAIAAGALDAGNRANGSRPVHAVESVAAVLNDSTLYQTFAWLERHLQRMKYSGRYGLVNWQARDRAMLEASLVGAPAVLDPSLELPRYYVSVDIHQHPGGVSGDPLAGAVYERGARSTTPLAGQRHADLHERFTQQVAALFGRVEVGDAGDASAKTASGLSTDLGTPQPGTPQALLDMGCGFGKSTLPFARAFGAARIEAIDLSAPCLRLAAKTQRDAQFTNVRYAQANAAATQFGVAEFDLVTSTMLLHELPPPIVKDVFREAARVLKAGGWMAHLDFLPQVQPGADAFSRFIHYGHARRNNEPFMEPLANMDLDALLAELGFTDVAIEAFEEAPGALDPANRNWRFPWAVIRARKAGG